MRRSTFLLTLIFILSSCGRNNQSGQNNPATNQFNNPLGVGSTNPFVSTVMQQYPCISGLPRSQATIPLNMQVAIGGTYIGVTSEGDVAVVTSNNGQGVLSAFICGRSSTTSGQGQLMGNPVINRSYNCQIDEITSASMRLPTQFGPVLSLNFRPIYFPPGSSLCN